MEPSVDELWRHFADIPLQEGFKLMNAPIVLQISLAQFKAHFVDDHAPEFLSHIQEEMGSVIIEKEEVWQEVPSDAIKAHRVAYDRVPVTKRRKVTVETPLPNPVLPVVKTDITYLMIEDTDTSLKMKTISQMTQKMIDFFSVDSIWEVYTPSPESQQVVVRLSNRQNWTSRPWALTPIIEWYSDY